MPIPAGRALAWCAVVVACTFLSPMTAPAQDVRLHAAPELVIPLGETDIYGLGGGASVTLEYGVLGFLAPYAGLTARSIAPAARGLDASLVLVSAGAGLGAYAFPLPRLKLGASAGFGAYVGSYANTAGRTMTGNLFWRLGAQAGYRLRPSLTLSGGLDFVDYRTETDFFYRGVAVSFVVDLGVGTRGAEGRVALQSAQTVPVFPVRASEYASVPLGSATILNAESAEVRNIEVWFHVDGYTSGPVLGGRVPYLPKGSTATVPLYAIFSDQVMTVTETVRVTGEVRILYELLGEPLSSRAETTVSILHRNAFTWDDSAVLASFVSPNDPALLETTKYVAGVIRSGLRPGLDANLQYALGLFEGFRLSGIAWTRDPQTPYASMRSTAALDYVQYPHQTLAYRGGDSDDLAVLYASGLESIAIPAAIVALDDDVLVAIRLDSSEATVRQTFLDPDAFVFVDGEAWAPVMVSLLREGFLRAWSEGARLFRETPDATERFSRLSEAWSRYPPAGVPGIPAVGRKPTEDQILAAFSGLVSLITDREVIPRAERLRSSFGPEGGTGRQRNALGVLYARYGLYSEAMVEFAAAVERGYTRAAVNVGNVAFLESEFETAAEWYQTALAETPDEASALIGMARALYELDRYEEADVYFRRAAEIRPDLAERYVYLSARLSGSTARASAAADRGGNVMWDE